MGLIKKSVIALIMAGIALFMLLYLRQFNVAWFDVLIMIFLIIATMEMDNAFRKVGFVPIRPALIVAVVAIYPLFILFGLPGIVLTAILSFMLAGIIMTFNHKIAPKDMIATVFILFYPIMMMGLFAEINHNIGGLFGIMAILLLSLMSDTFAQWVGMLIGGKKLCPTISPKKTVAGAFGEFLGGQVAAVILFLLFEYFKLFKNMPNVNFTGLTDNIWLSLPIYLILGILASGVSLFGDLFASWLKRQFGLKDFGTFLPGHGGIMDRADALLFTAPVMYFVFLLIPALAQ
jgi:phosphatidate cytidylyltransferase